MKIDYYFYSGCNIPKLVITNQKGQPLCRVDNPLQLWKALQDYTRNVYGCKPQQMKDTDWR